MTNREASTMPRLFLILLACCALAGCGEPTAQPPATAAAKAEAEPPAAKKLPRPNGGDLFMSYVADNYSGTPSGDAIADAKAGGMFAPTLKVTIGEDSAEVAANVCGFINTWILDTDLAHAEQGEVVGPDGGVIARCRPNEPTELAGD